MRLLYSECTAAIVSTHPCAHVMCMTLIASNTSDGPDEARCEIERERENEKGSLQNK